MPLSGSIIETAAVCTPGTARRRLAAARRSSSRRVRSSVVRAELDERGVQAVRLEAEVAGRQRRERPAEEAGGDDEHQRQRHLRRPRAGRTPRRAASTRPWVACATASVASIAPRPPRRDARPKPTRGRRPRAPVRKPSSRQSSGSASATPTPTVAELGHQEARAPHGEREPERPRPAWPAAGSRSAAAAPAGHARRRGRAAPTARAAGPRRAPAAGWRRWRRRRAARAPTMPISTSSGSPVVPPQLRQAGGRRLQLEWVGRGSDAPASRPASAAGSVAARICGCTLRSAAVAGVDRLAGPQPEHHAEPPRASGRRAGFAGAPGRSQVDRADRNGHVERAGRPSGRGTAPARRRRS